MNFVNLLLCCFEPIFLPHQKHPTLYTAKEDDVEDAPSSANISRRC